MSDESFLATAVKAIAIATLRAILEWMRKVLCEISYRGLVWQAVDEDLQKMLNRVFVVAMFAGGGTVASVLMQMRFDGPLVPIGCGLLATLAYIVALLTGIFSLTPAVRKYYRTLDEARARFAHARKPQVRISHTTD